MRRCFILLLIFISSCSGALIPKSEPPSFYQLNYQYQPVSFSHGTFQKTPLKVWVFKSSPPYSDTNMIVEGENSNILVSREHQWISSPGQLVAEWIRKDIDRDGFFGGAYFESILPAELELSGVVEKWSWQKQGDSYRASFEITITLWSKKPRPAILFKKNYAFQGELLKENNPDTFAKEMALLVLKFSKSFREELYQHLSNYKD